MKKIIAGLIMSVTLGLTSVMAEDSGLYVGLDLLANSNTFTTKIGSLEQEKDIGSKGFKLKFGTSSESGWRFQGYLLHEVYEETLFDLVHDEYNELGFDVIKGFEATPELSPFVQIGLGFGQMDITGYTEDSISAVSFKIGAGMMYKVTPMFELLAGIDFQGRAWQDITILSVTIQTSESSAKLYAGINLHF